jgi:hypothetical protein
MKEIVIVSLVAILSILMFNLTVYMIDADSMNRAGYSSLAFVETDPKIRSAMEFHGIIHAFKDNGEFKFIRDGKVCSLFTDSFEVYWIAKNLGKE